MRGGQFFSRGDFSWEGGDTNKYIYYFNVVPSPKLVTNLLRTYDKLPY